MGGIVLVVWLGELVLSTAAFFLSLAGWRVAKKNGLPRRLAVAGMILGGIPMVLLLALILRTAVSLVGLA